MYPPRTSPYATRSSLRSQGGFTLIELLMVVAVIFILVSITFGINRGVQNAQARTQAKAELAAIAQALEQFKMVNGDYPWTANGDPKNAQVNGVRVLQSLAGFMEFKRTGGTTSFQAKEELPDGGPKAFVDLETLSLNADLPADTGFMPPNQYLIDPWGNPYVYLYGQNNGKDWEVFGFYLYSKGPDSKDGVTNYSISTGVISDESGYREDASNLDNIYAGE